MVKETTENALVVQINAAGLEPESRENLLTKFAPFFEQAEQWKLKAESLVVTDVSQVHEMKMAREARLALKGIRTNAEKTRKDIKAESLRVGRAIDGVYNVIEYLIVPIEKHLEAQEKFAENFEAERKAKLESERIESIASTDSGYDYSFIDLKNMPEDKFQELLSGIKLAHENRIAEAQKKEQERIEAERKEAEERENQRLENIRLKAEAEAREKEQAQERERYRVASERQKKLAEFDHIATIESLLPLTEGEFANEIDLAKEAYESEQKREFEKQKKAAKEKQDADAKAAKLKAENEAKLKKEREAREAAEKKLADEKAAKEKAEREEFARQEAERKAKEKADKKAANAPDKAKLLALAKYIQDVQYPNLKGEEAQKILHDTITLMDKVYKFITEKTEQL